MDEYTFSPVAIGLARVWQCDTCGSLVGWQNDGLTKHIQWHVDMFRTTYRAWLGA